MDDGSDQGEVFRIRGNSLTVGRTVGEIQIPNDRDLSGQHARVELVAGPKQPRRFRLVDLDSTNGTFVRVHQALLTDGTDLILGAHRYRWSVDVPDHGTLTRMDHEDHPSWQFSKNATHYIGRTLPKPRDGHSSVEPVIELLDDPFLDSTHARIEFMPQQALWMMTNVESQNGVWCRIQTTWLNGKTEFRCGEQRFRFQFESPV
ncbi:MAG: FHA domain-containing protein [Planctomycetota bacterium]